MTQVSLKAGLAALLMLSCAPAALAQTYEAPQYPAPDDSQQQNSQDTQQQQQDEQQQQQQQYQDAGQRYEDQQQRYQDQRDVYQQQQNAYQGARARYEADRAGYDAEYGAGAWERYYVSHPDAYDSRYGDGAWERDFGRTGYNAYGPGDYAPDAGAYGAPSAYARSSDACESRKAGAGLAGGVIGAIAGGAIGSSVARGAARGGGTAIGAVLGGLVGVGIGRSAANCDDNGYYFSYDQTYPYREGPWESGPSGRYDYAWYQSHRCRLAVVPTTYDGNTEDRYVRVCPDADGLYRITG